MSTLQNNNYQYNDSNTKVSSKEEALKLINKSFTSVKKGKNKFILRTIDKPS